MNKKGKDHGFTLLEIVICLGLIALVLVAVFHLQAQNLDLQSEAQFMTTATWLLQERLSQIQSVEEIEEGTNSGDFGKDYPDYTYKQEVSEVPDTEGDATFGPATACAKLAVVNGGGSSFEKYPLSNRSRSFSGISHVAFVSGLYIFSRLPPWALIG